MKTSQLVNYLLGKYPLSNAHDIDMGKIGLQFGSMNSEVKKVMIALDGTLEVVKEAIDKGVDFLLLHHPFLFYPMLNLNYDTPVGKKMTLVFENKLNVFAMHTNFDVGANGMNDILARKLGLSNIHMVTEEVSNKSVLRVGEIEPMKLVDFVKLASTNLEEVSTRYVGDDNLVIKTVGIVGGAGSSELYSALVNKCDVLVTGEIHHHQAYDALENGIAIVEVSHSVERHFASELKKMLENEFKEAEFIISENNINPFKRG